MSGGKRRNSIISVGTVSIVLIFVMLSMLTFSVLSLVSAQADLRLSKKSAERTTAYYAAENEANRVRIEAETVLEDLSLERMNLEADALGETVADHLTDAQSVYAEGNVLSYYVPIEEEQLLSVTLTLSLTPFDDGQRTRVEQWRTVSRHEWAGSSGGALLDLDEFPFEED